MARTAPLTCRSARVPGLRVAHVLSAQPVYALAVPNAPVKDEVRASSRWSTWLWTAFWILWAVRGVSFLVDLGAVEPIVAVASWVSFGAVLIELSVRGLRNRPGR